MNILDEIDVSEIRIKQTRINIKVQEDQINDIGSAREAVLASQALLAVLESNLDSYIVLHKRLLSIAVKECWREETINEVYRPPSLLH